MFIEASWRLQWGIGLSKAEKKGVERYKVVVRILNKNNILLFPPMVWVFLFLAAVFIFVPVNGDGNNLAATVNAIIVGGSVLWSLTILYKNYWGIKPYNRARKNGRIVDLQNGIGQVFMDSVLFGGEYRLRSKEYRKQVLLQADDTLISLFLIDPLNRELLERLTMTSSGDARQLLRRALKGRASSILADIEPYAAPLRVKETSDATRRIVAADDKVFRERELAEVRQLLVRCGLTEAE